MADSELQASLEELRQHNEALAEAHEDTEAERKRYRELFDLAPDAYVVTDPLGIVTEANRTAVALLRCRRATMVGKPLSTFVAPESQTLFTTQLNRMRRANLPEDWEVQFRPRSGKAFPAAVSVRSVGSSKAGVSELRWLIRDISERKRRQAEQADQQARAYADEIVQTVPDPLMVLDVDLRVVSANRAFYLAFRTIPEETEGHLLYELGSGEWDIPRVREVLQRVAAKGARMHGMEVEALFLKVGRRSLLLSARRMETRGAPGPLTLLSMQDVTERKRAEAAVRAANIHNRSIIEASLDPLVTIDRDGRITDVNNATELATGRPRGKLVGTDFSDYFTDPARARAGYQQVFRDGEVRDYPLEIKHRNGQITPVLYNASLYRNEAGEVAGVFAAARDISERLKAEAALRGANAYNRSLIEAGLDPLVTIDREGRITDANGAAEQATGRLREELIGTDFCDYFTDPDQARAGYQQVFLDGEVREYPLQIKHRDGHVTPVLYNASLYYDEAGEVAGVFAAARDTTRLLQAEADLRTLAAEVALAGEQERRRIAVEVHDSLAQLLAFILMRLKAIEANAENSAQAQALNDIALLADEANTLTRSFIFELSPPMLYDLGLKPALEWLAEQMQQRHSISVTVEDNGRDRPLSQETRVVLFQAARELLANVVKHAEASQAVIQLSSTEGAIELVVEDDGNGFDPDKTAPRGPGLQGFGLFSIRERVRHIGGEVDIATRRGEGTRIKLSVPLEQDPSAS